MDHDVRLESLTYSRTAIDTDALPELESVSTDVAMVPIGGTYTMDYREAAGFVKSIGLPSPFHHVVTSGGPLGLDRTKKPAAAAVS